MKQHYEGSISQPGTAEWSEPCDAFAATAELAAEQVIERNLKCGKLEESESVSICVRRIAWNGDPLGDWEYFNGKAWVTYRSEVSAQSATPENDQP